MSLTIEPPVLVLNAHASFVKAAEPERAEVDVPEAVGDLLQPHVLPSADRGHVHPPPVPPTSTLGRHVPRLKPGRIPEGRHSVRHRSRRRRVARGWGLVVQRFVWPLVVELLAEDIEATLLRGEAARRGPRRLRLQG